MREACRVGRGDHVAVLCHNSTDIFEIQFACRKIGAVFLPLNWRLSKAEITTIVENAAPKVLFHGDEFQDVARHLCDSGRVSKIIDVRDGAPSAFEHGIGSAAPLTSSESVSHDDVFAIMYTSGATGRPKGAIITHRMTIFSGLNGMMKADVTGDSTGLTFLPLFHVSGLFLMANFIFHAGGHNIVMRSFDPSQALDLLADSNLRVTHAFGVPIIFAMMSEQSAFASCDLSHVRCLMVGGAPSPMSLLERYAERGIRLQQGWGMTETATLSTVLAADAAFSKIGSAGRAVMHAELSILDDAYSPVRRGGVGQLAIRGPTVTPGYWRQADATRAAFHDGWFLTGDAARQDEDGFYFIVDRWKDMYISGEENVYPAEIENVLSAIDGVAEAAVIGVPDDKWAEVGCAFVALRDGESVTSAKIVKHCEASLARFKLPKHIRFIDHIPHTAAGKISKPELRALYKTIGTR
jgi:fatty-acyl-CoA synthase